MKEEVIFEKLFELAMYSTLALIFSFFVLRFGGNEWGFEFPISAIIAAIYMCHVAISLSQYKNASLYVRVGLSTFILLFFWRQGDFTHGIVTAFQERMGLVAFFSFLGAVIVSVIASEILRETKKEVSGNIQKNHARSELVSHTSNIQFSDIIGQDHVIEPLKEIARLSAAHIKLGKENAPYAVLFFLGPTGVGKTEAARAIAQAVYGSQDALIRFDMGQFSDPHQANRFYGPPPGYVGFEQGGQLTRAVLKRPRSVVLLDEVEKADPKIWDAFLPVFDEGYIVDGSSNKKVDMRQTIIVLTSNLMADQPDVFSKSPSELKDALQRTGAFRPELVGRINEILVFKALEKNTIREILQRRIDNALWSLSAQGLHVSIDQTEVDEMVGEIQAAKFGVRQIDDVLRSHLRKHVSVRTSEPSYNLD